MSAPPQAPPLLEALLDPRLYGDDVTEVRIVETHISWVLLTGAHAYKIKKPVELAFLDFSSLAQRRHFCEEELRLNKRLAPQIYLDVVPIGGSPQTPELGAEPAIEYAVKMRQFPDDARLDRQLRDLDEAVLLEFAEHLARFHAQLPALPNAVPPSEEAAQVIRATDANLADLSKLVHDAALAAALKDIAAWTQQQSAALEPSVARRLGGNAHKECHGDLHLENLLIDEGEIVAFDALEFDPKLREIDVISEASFLAMDLLAHDRPDLAYGFLTRYLETGGDYGGLAVLRFYLVYRAMIRAKVRAIKAAQAKKSDPNELIPYFRTAQSLIRPRQPLLVITHGLSASGKTHITNELIGGLPALRVRSDLERKRLEGLAANASSGSEVGAGLYADGSSERTYARLLDVADLALSNGFDVIADATFLARDERRAFAYLAAQRRARFAILDCAAPVDVLRERIAKRAVGGGQPSEATHEVLDYQLAHQDPIDDKERAATLTIDTQGPPDFAALIRKLVAAD